MIFRRPKLPDWLVLIFLTLAALLLHGYHLGVDDQFVYLPAIRFHLDPSLYPGSTDLFLKQTRFMLFDEFVAISIRVTRLPFDWAIFLWHVFSLGLLLLGCLRIVRRCFVDRRAQWAGVASVAAMLLLMVAATLLFLADSYLHPRNLATALLLFSFSDILERKPRAVVWFACALLMHPTLAVFAGLHLLFQAWPARARAATALPMALPTLAAGTGSDAWREVLQTRWFLFPMRWPWFAWLGVFIPLGLLAWWTRLKQATPTLRRVSARLFFSGLLGTLGGLLITVIPGFERLIPTEPMRTLHLVNLLVVLLGGGLLGQYVLRDRPLRWVALFLPLCAVMFYQQRQLYPGSDHIEWPGRSPGNEWARAFHWVREKTPLDARFALDPRYMERPGQDFHSFAALAVRPALHDYSKDRGVVATWPELAPAWREQMRALEGWNGFGQEDFLRLRRLYGATWVVVEPPAPPGLVCPYAGERVLVCRIE